MPPNVFFPIVYLVGFVLSARWMWNILDPEMKTAVIPTALGPFPPGIVTVLATALLWPVSVPLHLVGLVRKRFGWLTEFEKKRMK